MLVWLDSQSRKKGFKNSWKGVACALAWWPNVFKQIRLFFQADASCPFKLAFWCPYFYSLLLNLTNIFILCCYDPFILWVSYLMAVSWVFTRFLQVKVQRKILSFFKKKWAPALSSVRRLVEQEVGNLSWDF